MPEHFFHFLFRKRSGIFLLLFLTLFTGLLQARSSASATYFVTEGGELDIEKQNHSYITFPIVMTGQLPTHSAALTVYSWDVDEEDGEVNYLYFNGHKLGKVSGQNDIWNTSTFILDPSWVKQGENTVVYEIDVNNGGWISKIDWAQLLIDGGSGDKANITNMEVSNWEIIGSDVVLYSDIHVHADSAGTYKLETNLNDPSRNNLNSQVREFTMAQGEDRVIRFNFNYPLNSPTGTYVVYANLFEKDTFLQQTFYPFEFYHKENEGVNLPPTVSVIGEQNIFKNQPTSVDFTIGDDATDSESLSLVAYSSKGDLIPNSNLVLGGSGSNRTLKLTPNADKMGTSYITVEVSDGTSVTKRSFYLNVLDSSNSAPELDNSKAPVLTSITAGDTDNFGNRVEDIVIDGSITDPDGSVSESIVVTEVDDTNGTWQYSIDGGSTWKSFGSVSEKAGILLDSDDLVRFQPNGGWTGESTFKFAAWDKSSGNSGDSVDVTKRGGTTPFSSDTDSAAITVKDASTPNRAPVLDDTFNPMLSPISKNSSGGSGNTVSEIVANGSITDADGPAAEAIAVVGVDNANGRWQYSVDGETWHNIENTSDSNALLLDTESMIRFIPQSDFAGNSTFFFRAWDKTAGSGGSHADASANGGATAFSSQYDAAAIIVSNSNRAPLLNDSASHRLTPINEDNVNSNGNNVSEIVADGSITDPDGPVSEAIAVTDVDNTNGKWQYSTDNGSTWNDFGTVSENSARLLSSGDRIRFIPNRYYIGLPTITFAAWDKTTGAAGETADVSSRGGSTSFSSNTDTAFITVKDVNYAPTITGSEFNLTSITEREIDNSGDLISSIIAGKISDPDTASKEGIAIYGKTGNGKWQFSYEGTYWIDINNISETSALLLLPTTRIRYIPDGVNGETATFSFVAWDQTEGSTLLYHDITNRGGNNAFSTNSAEAKIEVTSINEAPKITGSRTLSTDEEKSLEIELSDLVVTDNDNPYPLGFTLEILDGNGYVHNGATVTPVKDLSGTIYVSARVNDGDLDSNIYSVPIVVSNVNDKPVVENGISNKKTNEDELFSFTVPPNTFKDVDAGDKLSYTATLADGSALPSWLGFDEVTGTFSGTPKNENVGTISIKLTASDKAGEKVTTDFQLEVVNINDAPVIKGQSAISVEEDKTITLDFEDLTVEDVDNNYPDGFSIIIENGDNYTVGGTSITPAKDFNGDLSVNVRVRDGIDSSDSFKLNVKVEAVNDAPYFVSPTPSGTVNVKEDEKVEFTVAAEDVDGDRLTYGGENLPAGASVDPETGVFTCIPGWKQIGNHQLTLTVTDGNKKISRPITIAVASVDTDGDGLTDGYEKSFGLDPDSKDSDNDGITDKVEVGDDLDNPRDSDGDGTIDGLDDDSDDDGIKDKDEAGKDSLTEGPRDTDGDGIPDYRDTDSDNDGVEDTKDNCILVKNESQEDADENGTGDVCENDKDGDGISDEDEKSMGTDPENRDSDKDGIDDGKEVGDDHDNPKDSDADGKIDALDDDSDGDGISDEEEGDRDSDHDGTPDYLDNDSDNDGVEDSKDKCRIVANSDQADEDDNGIGNVCEGDTDGDGVSDEDEKKAGSDPKNSDSDHDGIDDAKEIGNDPENPVDTDGDGTADVFDDDSDNDGISDEDEGAKDTDGDGKPDFQDNDSDGDGVEDGKDNCRIVANGDQADIDKDGTGDLCDGDTDGDGISDEDEKKNGTDPKSKDSDGDGIDDSKETGEDHDNPKDSDGDGTIDALDDDSDGDGISDKDESGKDTDGDGTPDTLDDDSDGDGVKDRDDNCLLLKNPDQSDIDGDKIGDLCDDDMDGDGLTNDEESKIGTDPEKMDSDGDGITDEKEVGEDKNDPKDTDGDGTIDALDDDSDGDGISDKDESGKDTDKDGTPDHLDTDSDDDGVEDGDDNCLLVKNSDQKDTDGNGIGDACDGDNDGDGISDEKEEEMGTDPDKADSDGDGIDDKTETEIGTDPTDDDSDGDGIKDGDEVGDDHGNPVDSDGDGKIDALDEDSDGDGVKDKDEKGDEVKDTDGDGRPDHLDDDSDNDGVKDSTDNCILVKNPNQEDYDNDGIGDVCEKDSDGDGIPDEIEEKIGSDPEKADSDGDGIKDGDEIGNKYSGEMKDSDGDGEPDIFDLENNNPYDENMKIHGGGGCSMTDVETSTSAGNNLLFAVLSVLSAFIWGRFSIRRKQ